MSALNKLSNLTQRIISGIIGASLLIFGVTWSQWSFGIVIGIIMLLSQWELYTLFEKGNYKPSKIIGCVLGGLIYLASFLSSVSYIPLPPPKIFLLLFLCAFVVFIIKLFDSNDPHPFINISISLLGIYYISTSWTVFMMSSFQVLFDYQVPLGCLLLLWASDTGAYFTGKAFGKNKLFERISPKKTWEGSFGGAILSFTTAWVLSIYFKSLEGWQWFILAAIIIIFGTLGDLVESMLKRSIQVKDSGNVIPGHGGFLDRFDGLLLASPFIYLFLCFFK